MLRVSMLIVGDVACGLIRFCHFQIDVTIPFTKLHNLFERDKALREEKVALHGQIRDLSSVELRCGDYSAGV